MKADSSTDLGEITYEVNCLGPDFPRSEAHWNSEFPKIIIESHGHGVVSIEVKCSTSHDVDKTRRRARAIVERIVRELAFRFSCSTGRPVELSSRIFYIDSHGLRKARVQAGLRLRFGGTAGTRWSPAISSVQEAAVAARDTATAQRDLDLELYRSATASVDPVARFIPLYTTLQKVTSTIHSQDDLDDWICLATTGTVHVTPKPAGRQGERRTTETDFTRVRNSLAHVRSGQTSFSPVLDEAKRLVVSLQELVAQAISQKHARGAP